MEAVTCERVVQYLREIANWASDGPLVDLTRRNNLKILYEFLDGEQVVPYHFILQAGNTVFQPGALDYQECDLVIRTTPETLYKILAGQLSSREVLLSGALDIRKAPTMNKLLLFRALFNQYRKSKLREADRIRAK